MGGLKPKVKKSYFSFTSKRWWVFYLLFFLTIQHEGKVYRNLKFEIINNFKNFFTLLIKGLLLVMPLCTSLTGLFILVLTMLAILMITNKQRKQTSQHLQCDAPCHGHLTKFFTDYPQIVRILATPLHGFLSWCIYK